MSDDTWDDEVPLPSHEEFMNFKRSKESPPTCRKMPKRIKHDQKCHFGSDTAMDDAPDSEENFFEEWPYDPIERYDVPDDQLYGREDSPLQGRKIPPLSTQKTLGSHGVF